MTNFLTSQQTLEQICDIEPSKDLGNGIMKSVLGLPSVTISTIASKHLIYETIYTIRRNPIISSLSDKICECSIQGMGLVLAGVFFLGGMYCLLDATSSFSSTMKKQSNSVYYVNQGYSNKNRIFNNLFCDKVKPIESKDELEKYKGFVLLNGVYIKDVKTRHKKEHRPHIIGPDGRFDKYYTLFDCDFKGQKLKVVSIDEDMFMGNTAKDAVKKLLSLKGSYVYLGGKVRNNQNMLLYSFGKALEVEE